MRALLLPALALVLGCEPAPHVDHYILALSWQPAFCERNAAKPECRELDDGDFAATNLALHGLWPSAADGEHPFYCGVGSDHRAADEAGDWCALPETGADPATQSDLARLMPGSRSCLDRHEWIKHGACSSLDGDAYFDASIRLVRQVQATQLAELLRGNLGRHVTLRNMLLTFEQEFGAGAAAALEIACWRDSGRAYLAEIRLALHPEVIERAVSAKAPGKALSRNALFLEGATPDGGCPARIFIDPAQ